MITAEEYERGVAASVTPNQVFYCTDHDYVYPTGVASIIVAPNKEEAFRCLDTQLMNAGLRPSAERMYTLTRLNITEQQAIILCSGDY